ncbi:FliH/SctL family protein [Bdellovibrio sp. SKB1291214]|uniref:FliH/SctL family protein n=1 Tax=Bdellovibrio sp. SKB1291214 TaxID=1732569 RepID=UPI000B51A1A5|nr:FliH/SctL family protein [Bdellovibrio sp. SKB1291214]UYL08743.1 FliH/SctL family protein [Bdellovibrio sp. SKB1291214]
MQWSNSSKQGPGAHTKAVLKKEVAEKTVLEFVPAKIELGTPSQAMQYLTEKKRGSDFRMNDAIRVQTGVDQVERVDEEEKIEAAALDKLKEIQEQAYQEAYNLGLEEGRKEAFEKVSAEIIARMQGLDELLLGVKELKKDLTSFNENHLVTLAYKMAGRLAKAELATNNDAMIQILRDAVALAQDEEQITVHVSQEQFDFLEELKKETGRDLEFTKKIRFEPSAEIIAGGCIVETNYGEVDARVEQRLEQLWTVLSENMPKVKDKVAS